MLQIGRELDLGQKPIHPDDGGELGAQHLERDITVVPDVAREVDRRHTAFADAAKDLVATVERALNVSGHGDCTSLRVDSHQQVRAHPSSSPPPPTLVVPVIVRVLAVALRATVRLCKFDVR